MTETQGRLGRRACWSWILFLASSTLAADQPLGRSNDALPASDRPLLGTNSSSLSPRPSAFLSDLQVSSSHSTSAPSPAITPAKEPTGGWIRRVVSDWLHRGNHSEPAGNFFTRIRQHERLASDSLLVSRCRSLLVSDASVRAHFIHIAANDGVLTLRGQVPTQSVREQAEKLARHTVGMVDLRNELKVGLSGSIEQTSYASASLAPPTRLDGGDLAEPLPLPSVAMRETPSAALGAFIEPLTGSSLSPVVPPLSVAMMPPARHRTVEQQVAKPAAEPEVLPSGQRLWAGTGRKATIPAPPSSNRSVLSSPPLAGNIGVLPSSAESPSVLSSDRLTDQKSADVAALLLKDPRARALTFTLRQSEVRLAGSVAKPEDLFALADLLDALPGIDFVSFDDVQFQIP